MKIIFKKENKTKEIIVPNCSILESVYIKDILHIKMGFKSPEYTNRLADEFLFNKYTVYRDNDKDYYYILVAQATDITFKITL